MYFTYIQRVIRAIRVIQYVLIGLFKRLSNNPNNLIALHKRYTYTYMSMSIIVHIPLSTYLTAIRTFTTIIITIIIIIIYIRFIVILRSHTSTSNYTTTCILRSHGIRVIRVIRVIRGEDLAKSYDRVIRAAYIYIYTYIEIYV